MSGRDTPARVLATLQAAHPATMSNAAIREAVGAARGTVDVALHRLRDRGLVRCVRHGEWASVEGLANATAVPLAEHPEWCGCHGCKAAAGPARDRVAEIEQRLAEVEANLRRARRSRWARGSARVRDFRQRLRLALLMVDRLRARLGERPHRHLVGSVEQLQERAAELPKVNGTPFSSLAKGGDA